MHAIGMALWRALPSALLMALLAPPLAAVALLGSWWLHPATGAELAGQSAGSAMGLLLGAVLAAYLLGGLPAFAAGLLQRWATLRFGPARAALLMAFLGTTAYFLTFGAHLLGDASLAEVQHTVWRQGMPTALGLAVASWLVSRLEK